jgi:hypothetical protein
MLLLAAAALPSLLWTAPPASAPQLKEAGVHEFFVPAGGAASWRGLGFDVKELTGDCVKLNGPRVNFRPNVARATSSPWVDSNAPAFQRMPDAKFCVEASAPGAGLAAAEAWAYGVEAYIAQPFGKMLAFLKGLPALDLPPMANIGIVNDGTPQAGELMNLLTRRNLLFRVLKAPDPKLDVNVTAIDPGDPSRQAYAIRQKLGDDKRLLRLYGSEVVIGRLTGDGSRARLHLLNYSQRPVNGLRVRVAGMYSKAEMRAFGVPDAKPLDFSADAEATEFTVPTMNEYVVVDLRR